MSFEPPGNDWRRRQTPASSGRLSVHPGGHVPIAASAQSVSVGFVSGGRWYGGTTSAELKYDSRGVASEPGIVPI